MIIEYDSGIRENLIEFLELYGYHVFAVTNGKDGIECLPVFLPDLIICDVIMPVMDGYQVFSSIFSHLHKNKVPFIFCSTKSEKKDHLEGIGLGANDYIIKPFELDILLTSVRACLQVVA